MHVKNPVLPLFLLWALVVSCPASLSAQQADRLPPFSMTLSSGQYFHSVQIPKGKPVLLVYFDPECDHCHTLMNAFFKRPADFAAAEVLMVTFKPLSEVQSFVKAYQVHKFPNIKVGTEGTTYYLRGRYNMQSSPFVVLYNRAGKLVAGYQKDIPLEALYQKLKNS